jgi:hypothetical protein
MVNQHTPPLQPPIPCTLALYLSADAGKPARILLRHTVVGLLRRHDPILYSCLKDKEQRHGACGLAVFLFPTKRTDQTSAPRLEDWVVPSRQRRQWAEPFHIHRDSFTDTARHTVQ